MNISLLKLVSLLSGFIGIICGLLALLPFIDGFVFFVLMCLPAIIVISMLMKLNLLRIESVPESITIGAITGFVSFLVFSIIYIPIVIIMMRTMKYYTNEGVALILSHANLFILIMVSVFFGILSATINAFSGFLVYYVSEIFKNMNNR